MPCSCLRRRTTGAPTSTAARSQPRALWWSSRVDARGHGLASARCDTNFRRRAEPVGVDLDGASSSSPRRTTSSTSGRRHRLANHGRRLRRVAVVSRGGTRMDEARARGDREAIVGLAATDPIVDETYRRRLDVIGRGAAVDRRPSSRARSRRAGSRDPRVQRRKLHTEVDPGQHRMHSETRPRAKSSAAAAPRALERGEQRPLRAVSERGPRPSARRHRQARLPRVHTRGGRRRHRRDSTGYPSSRRGEWARDHTGAGSSSTSSKSRC